ncbi:MAG: hypothetical protein J6Y23_13250 [Prevotella sp.]|nr:hypothetical protein [Prevotella sp.]
MRKKILFFLFAVLSALTMTTTSCSSDDDDNGFGSSSAGLLDDELRLRSVGNISFYYDEDGRLDYIHTSRGNYNFSYNPGKITTDDSDDIPSEVSYTSKGYLSSLNEKHVDEGSWGSETEIGKSSFSYDGSGHLTKVSSTYKITVVEKGEKESYTENSTITLTWKSDMLQKVVWDEKDDDGYRYTETWTYGYEKDYKENYFNKYCQYAPSVANWLEDEWVEGIAYVGLFGKGPLYLPSDCDYEDVVIDDEGKKETDYRSWSSVYSFNSNGSLSYVNYNGRKYSYSYSQVESSSKKSPSWGLMLPQKEKRHSLFRSRHRLQKNK